MIAYFETQIVQLFISRISPEIFAEVVYRIVQNPNENRSGVSDFVIWNDQESKMVEVKKVREQVWESQKATVGALGGLKMHIYADEHPPPLIFM